MNNLGRFVRVRSRDLGLSLAEVARRSGKSRQTLHQLSYPSPSYPQLKTLVDVARVLRVHPLELLQHYFNQSHSAATPKICCCDHGEKEKGR